MTSAALVTLQDASVTFATSARRVNALRNCSLELRAGETLAVIGESGSGKSTLARLIAGLIRPSSGLVNYQPRDRDQGSTLSQLDLRRRIQMIFQDPDASLNPAYRVRTIVSEPLIVRRYGSADAIEKRVIELMQQVKLDASLLARRPHQLSGGQKQRVAIARALAMDPDVLLADEPLSALDLATGAAIAQLLRALREQLAISMLFISHDLRVVRQIASRVVVLYAGQIVESGPVELLDAPRHPYTQLLVAATPGEHRAMNFDLVDAIDSVARLPASANACGYRPTCLARGEICGHEPALKPLSTNALHTVRCHRSHVG